MLTNCFVLLQFFHKFASRTVFRYEVVVEAVLENFEKLYDVRMIHFLQNIGFFEQRLLVKFGEFLFFYLFHCSYCVGNSMRHQVHSTVSPFSQNLANCIMVAHFRFIYNHKLPLSDLHLGESVVGLSVFQFRLLEI